MFSDIHKRLSVRLLSNQNPEMNHKALEKVRGCQSKESVRLSTSTKHTQINRWLFDYFLSRIIPPHYFSPSSLYPFLLGMALIDASEAMKELGEVKDALDMEVKQNFIDPLQNLHDKDLKEIQVSKTPLSVRLLLNDFRVGAYYCPRPLQHHLKKMEGRRLDFDYKKKRQGKVQEDEIKQALEKFDESKEIAEQSMFNLLESDVRTPDLLLCLGLELPVIFK